MACCSLLCVRFLYARTYYIYSHRLISCIKYHTIYIFAFQRYSLTLLVREINHFFVILTLKSKLFYLWRTLQFSSARCYLADIERPKFSKNEECYNGIELTNNTVKDKNYGLVNFEAIGITDNSGGPITVVSSPPGYELGRSYQIGITKMNQPLAITFHATDASGNSEQCRFRIQIKGKSLTSIC